MFHGVMVALEFLVLSVIVRIGVEQHPLPPRVLRIFFPALAQDSFFLAVSFLDTAFLVFFRPFLPPRTLRCGAGCHFYQIFMPGSLQTVVLMSNFARIQVQSI